jgi:hypothetical protein
MAFMPWENPEPMTEKERFVTLALTGRFTITELCTDFGISRKTAVNPWIAKRLTMGHPSRVSNLIRGMSLND